MRQMMMKSFSLAVLTAMTLAALAAPAMAATGFGGGSGIETDPYIVRTRAHLEAMHDPHGSWTSGKWFRLDRDIDLGGKKASWTPIDFAGHFDGNGHAITGLWVARTGADPSLPVYAGLFGQVQGGTIKRLTVHGTVSAKSDGDMAVAGGIVANLGMPVGGGAELIEDCHFVGTVTAEGEAGATVGGIAGVAFDSAVKNCTASGKATAKTTGGVSRSDAIAGGIVGMFVGGDKGKHVLTGCVADVEVGATGGQGQGVGGVAGAYETTPLYPPSGNSWYGKGAAAGLTVFAQGANTFVLSNDGARKGTGAKILSRWLPEGKTGRTYDEKVIVAGKGTLELDSGALPDGLKLSGTRIAGVPTKAGKATFTLKAGGSSQKFSIRIRNGSSPVDIETLELSPVAEAQELMVQMEASGTTGKVTWSVLEGELPEGVELSADGVLSGAATTAGTYTFTVMVVDAKNNGATQELTLMVKAGGDTPPLMEELTGPDLKYSFQPNGVVSMWLEGEWRDDMTGDTVEGVTETWTVNDETVAKGDDGRVNYTVPAGTRSLAVKVVGEADDGRKGTVSWTVTIPGGGGDDPSGKKSGGGGCDMGLGGLAMMALAGAATRRKRS